MFHKRLIACVAVALLTGCNSNAPEQAGAAGSGKVLPGSVSDDMLPYDTATSQPPLMAPEPSAAASGTSSAVDGDTPTSNESEAAETPAAAPSEAAPSPATT